MIWRRAADAGVAVCRIRRPGGRGGVCGLDGGNPGTDDHFVDWRPGPAGCRWHIGPPEPEVEAPAPEAPAPTQDSPPPDVRLLGVLSGGARTSALLSVAGDDPQWQDIGARIEGWTLDEIAADHVVFTEQERAHRVELYQR